ncbi:hypothetical protein [Alkalicoccus luteus]|uniref:Uncharacterized protein n=1 Tax=Alkalicoccus luteus TaxID=1237094 RepID=A0A969TTR6_9BACI|nr:hypothetical protein [Alkalicoccus luteus]NJP36201.1 hypothetical protein [Alkalicoccus luteus]
MASHLQQLLWMKYGSLLLMLLFTLLLFFPQAAFAAPDAYAALLEERLLTFSLLGAVFLLSTAALAVIEVIRH